MTLKESWDNCIEMWEWIVSQLLDDWVYRPGDYRISDLKKQWATEHGGTSCYFCEYAGNDGCPGCPGMLVDPKFSCVGYEYDYRSNPREFLAKIKELFKEYQNDTIG